jgi:enterochelin esterase-like enzyme
MTKSLIIATLTLYIFTRGLDAQRGSREIIPIPAPALQNNILGEETEQNIQIYLPPSYHSESNKRYPVIYYLHGYGGKVHRELFCKIIDTLIVNKKVPELIFIEISGYNLTSGSFYVNSDVTGNWGDFVVKDVVNYIDKHYRTINHKSSRALTGFSKEVQKKRYLT